MKYRNQLLTAVITICLLSISSASYADDLDKSSDHDNAAHAEHDHSQHAGDHSDHDHDSHAGHDHGKDKAGLNGGRLITTVEPHLEFFVTEENFVQITFLDEDDQVVAPKKQSVSLIGGDRQNPVRLRFEKKGKVLISSEALPEGNNLPIILSIKPGKESKAVRERFNLNLNDCPTCDYKEYACTCAHGEDGHEGHDH